MSPEQRKQLGLLFGQLECVCSGSMHWHPLLEQIEANEKSHRRMGARFTRGAAKYKESVWTAVQFFACKCILEPLKAPGSWSEAAAVRTDYMLGQTIREMAESRPGQELRQLEATWELLALEYSEDIAR